MITLIRRCRTLPGKYAAARDRIRDIARSMRDEPGNWIFFCHRPLPSPDPTEATDLTFFEVYADEATYRAHLESAPWRALQATWSDLFEGTPEDGLRGEVLDRIADL
ncbi:antibiotic biosynthesis monooxygenase [Sorangium sp. So ce1014]|uniref:putative quinol monooxygenase n=1 Tax=Sorangium sp. So ce1014 TaxID=3133326 RepID=UPI003F5EBCFA